MYSDSEKEVMKREHDRIEKAISAISASANQYNIVNEIAADRYRGTIIIGASWIDDKLGTLLAKVILSDPSKAEELFGPERELGTFGSKIKLSQLMGLLDADFISALQIIRRLRNDFAHSFVSHDIEKPPHSDQIDQLRSLVLRPDAYALQRIIQRSEKLLGVRRWFVFATSSTWICNALDNIIATAATPAARRFSMHHSDFLKNPPTPQIVGLLEKLGIGNQVGVASHPHDTMGPPQPQSESSPRL
jgi:hypothetical protein